MVHQYLRDLISEWRRLELPFDSATVVIAVSGGADSVSLLLAVDELKKQNKLDLRIVAAHFNHNLRGAESDADQEFVKHLTAERGIELAVGHGQIDENGNLEQNARNARYEFLHGTAANLHAFAVLTGHTVNDQAETFLMNLIRGSGLEGLSGMSVVRKFDEEKRGRGEEVKDAGGESPLLIRPLLTWAKRGDTEEYCHDSGVEYRYDTMNEDTAFKRVRIRKILLPLLEDMNPKIIETLANTASLMGNTFKARSEGNQNEPDDELNLATLKALDQPALYDTIRAWLLYHRGTKRQLGLKHIKAIERLILSEKSGRCAELPGGRIVKTGGKLVYDENKVEN
ncbi:hypothetical protein BH10ACI3_BH10ACI3_02930 [soil metagenome]